MEVRIETFPLLTRMPCLSHSLRARSSARYYAHISGAQDGACKYERKGCHKGVKGSCQSKVKIHWG